MYPGPWPALDDKLEDQPLILALLGEAKYVNRDPDHLVRSLNSTARLPIPGYSSLSFAKETGVF